MVLHEAMNYQMDSEKEPFPTETLALLPLDFETVPAADEGAGPLPFFIFGDDDDDVDEEDDFDDMEEDFDDDDDDFGDDDFEDDDDDYEDDDDDYEDEDDDFDEDADYEEFDE